MYIYIYVQYNIFSTWLIVAQAAAKQWIRRNAATSRSLARHSVRNAVQSYITYIYIYTHYDYDIEFQHLPDGTKVVFHAGI